MTKCVYSYMYAYKPVPLREVMMPLVPCARELRRQRLVSHLSQRLVSHLSASQDGGPLSLWKLLKLLQSAAVATDGEMLRGRGQGNCGGSVAAAGIIMAF